MFTKMVLIPVIIKSDRDSQKMDMLVSSVAVRGAVEDNPTNSMVAIGTDQPKPFIMQFSPTAQSPEGGGWD